jgi:hypothetical protein
MFSPLSISNIVGSLMMLMSGFHPLHVSVTEIEMDEKDKRLEIKMRVFIDDFETSLREKSGQPELIVLELSTEARNGLISDYLKDHFNVSLDSKSQKMKYIGHEQENDAFIFYIEVPSVKKWKTIHIQNNIIMGTYSDQSNLVHVTVREKTKSLRLTKDNPADNLTFDF